jgi:hypothetical protein
MRNLTRARKGLSFSSLGASFSQPNVWSFDRMMGSPSIAEREDIANDFDGYVSKAYKANGVIFTNILIRQYVFSEVRFQLQRFDGGRPTELFGNPSLRILERPWPNGTTGELLSRMEQDVSLAGNFFATTVGEGDERRIRRLRPDWVTIVTAVPDRPDASPFDLEARPVAYLYRPPRSEPVLLDAGDVVHWSPIPDPVAQWRGMSWITPLVREIQADTATTRHKLKFFENGATSNTVITYDPSVSQQNVAAFAKMFAEQHAGVDKAYKTVHLGGGADAKMVGADLKQLDFKVTQGAGESRISAASMVGAVMAQFSEGMAGSSLNAGNFQASRRRFADVWARPQWRSAAAALAKFVEVPTAARLWYDARDVAFLQEDEKDAADIFAQDSASTRTLTDAGYTPESVKAAVSARDLRLLVHTGHFSVQLQPPGMTSAEVQT